MAVQLLQNRFLQRSLSWIVCVSLIFLILSRMCFFLFTNITQFYLLELCRSFCLECVLFCSQNLPRPHCIVQPGFELMAVCPPQPPTQDMMCMLWNPVGRFSHFILFSIFFSLALLALSCFWVQFRLILFVSGNHNLVEVLVGIILNFCINLDRIYILIYWIFHLQTLHYPFYLFKSPLIFLSASCTTQYSSKPCTLLAFLPPHLPAFPFLPPFLNCRWQFIHQRRYILRPLVDAWNSRYIDYVFLSTNILMIKLIYKL